jgi:hypothetical protein
MYALILSIDDGQPLVDHLFLDNPPIGEVNHSQKEPSVSLSDQEIFSSSLVEGVNIKPILLFKSNDNL